MEPTPKIIALVNRAPDLDEFGKVHGTPWAENESLYDAILDPHGIEGIRQVIGMLQAVDDGTDYKARYVLHGMVMLSGRSEKAVSGEQLRSALGEELAQPHPAAIKGFLLRQLHLCGDSTSVPRIAEFLTDEENGDDAAQALQAIGGEASVAALRAALTRALDQDRMLLRIVQGLGKFRDARSAADIRGYLKHSNEEVRLTTAWALANIGDEEAVNGLLELVDQAEGWARTQLVDAIWTLAEVLERRGLDAEALPLRERVDKIFKDSHRAS